MTKQKAYRRGDASGPQVGPLSRIRLDRGIRQVSWEAIAPRHSDAKRDAMPLATLCLLCILRLVAANLAVHRSRGSMPKPARSGDGGRGAGLKPCSSAPLSISSIALSSCGSPPSTMRAGSSITS